MARRWIYGGRDGTEPPPTGPRDLYAPRTEAEAEQRKNVDAINARLVQAVAARTNVSARNRLPTAAESAEQIARAESDVKQAKVDFAAADKARDAKRAEQEKRDQRAADAAVEVRRLEDELAAARVAEKQAFLAGATTSDVPALAAALDTARRRAQVLADDAQAYRVADDTARPLELARRGKATAVYRLARARAFAKVAEATGRYVAELQQAKREIAAAKNDDVDIAAIRHDARPLRELLVLELADHLDEAAVIAVKRHL